MIMGALQAGSDTSAVPGPILILGAGGFIGNACLRRFLSVRDDVLGVYHRPNERLRDLPSDKICSPAELSERWEDLWKKGGFRTVLDFAAAGAAGGKVDDGELWEANFLRVTRLVRDLQRRTNVRYLFAGSSSEYGFDCDRPSETQKPSPSSPYGVSKAAASAFLEHVGREENFPCAVLRLFSVYGPGEAPSRLMPTLARTAQAGAWPPLAEAEVAHDFIHVDDVLRAFETVAARLEPKHHGGIWNVGTGRQTTLRELSDVVRDLWSPEGEPSFGSYPRRPWDQTRWEADISRLRRDFPWEPTIPLREGLLRFAHALDRRGIDFTKDPPATERKRRLSVVVALYKDGPAIDDLVREVGAAFSAARVEGELILVNDASPDDAEERIRFHSLANPWIIGITHSRNFGSQAAFLSGLEIATGDAAVLMDGDLQDPPELLPALVEKWRSGAAVVLARRRRRDMSWAKEAASKWFYRLWNWTSDHPIPLDVGDFSLMDRSAIKALLSVKASDPFLRAHRAFVGFPTASVDYVRPARRYGRSTNSWFSLFRWALKALSASSGRVFEFCILLQAAALIIASALSLVGAVDLPRGWLLVLVPFGAGQILAEVFLLRVWRQSLQRPLFVRRHRIRNGAITPWE